MSPPSRPAELSSPTPPSNLLLLLPPLLNACEAAPPARRPPPACLCVCLQDAHNLLRPEAVESFYLLWKVTGHPRYRQWAWQVFRALDKWARVRPQDRQRRCATCQLQPRLNSIRLKPALNRRIMTDHRINRSRNRQQHILCPCSGLPAHPLLTLSGIHCSPVQLG